jgi:hypothetical protein
MRFEEKIHPATRAPSPAQKNQIERPVRITKTIRRLIVLKIATNT